MRPSPGLADGLEIKFRDIPLQKAHADVLPASPRSG